MPLKSECRSMQTARERERVCGRRRVWMALFYRWRFISLSLSLTFLGAVQPADCKLAKQQFSLIKMLAAVSFASVVREPSVSEYPQFWMPVAAFLGAKYVRKLRNIKPFTREFLTNVAYTPHVLNNENKSWNKYLKLLITIGILI